MNGVVHYLLVIATVLSAAVVLRADDELFVSRVAPVLARRCLGCHNPQQRKGEMSLATGQDLFESGYVVAGEPASSYLLDLITPSGGQAEMPKNSDPLTEDQLSAVRDWIERGANWPAQLVLQPPVVTSKDWWSLKPLIRPEVPAAVPSIRDADGKLVAPASGTWNEIDAFIARKHIQAGLSFAPPASRGILIRRVYFDLIGLPPTPAQIECFVHDPASDAYEKLVDQLLASPRYGERWARHWLDVVHYGDTHGYDKDKPRPNAWPYRDYVIRSLNDDKPWSRFVREQVAGDVLFPGTRDGIEALGFIAAGPWDFVGHAEVPETKVDGKIARHLDRDDMVRNTIQSFNSLTVGWRSATIISSIP